MLKDENWMLLEEYLVETTSRGVLLVAREGTIAFVNPGFIAMVGGDGTCGVGEPFHLFLPRLPDCPAWRGPPKRQFLQHIGPFLAKQEHRAELFFQPGHWMQLTGRAMSSGGYVLTITDVSSFHQTMNNIRLINKNTIKSLADIAENRDHDTGEHVLKVARMTHEIAWDLKDRGLFLDRLTDPFLTQVGLASILHDVGKVSIPDAVLLKPGRLTPEEMEVMKGHARSGFRIIHKIQDMQADTAYFELAAAIALSHHEKFAGQGYPHGIQGEEIPLEARIVAVSDVFDALTSWRPYKDPWSEENTLAFMDEQSGQMFDPRVVESLHRVLRRRWQQSVVLWEPAMSVGEGTMDKDHRILIDLINQLALATSRLDAIIMDFVLDELYNYTVRHFHREELYMQSCGFSDIERHRQVHQEFSRRVSDLRLGFMHNPDPEISSELMPVLGSWLRSHIQGMDQEYHRFIRSHENA